MENFISSRIEPVHKPTALKCCGGGGDETTSMDSTKASMLECGEYVDQISFWQRPRQRIDLEFVDVSYRVKLGRNGKWFYKRNFLNVDCIVILSMVGLLLR